MLGLDLRVGKYEIMMSKPRTPVSLLQSSVQIGTLVMISMGVFLMAVDLGRRDEMLRRIQVDTAELKVICSDLVKAQVRAVINDENLTNELALLSKRLDELNER